MNPRRTLLSALLAGTLMLAACGGDDDAPNEDTADETTTTEASPTDGDGSDGQPAVATAPVEALRVSFESVHDGPFRLFDLDGDLWLVESDFGAFRVDLTVPVSGCDITACLENPSVDFGDTFIPVGPRLFTITTEFSPNQFVWIGSEVTDGPHNVHDDNTAPGTASGDFSDAIARVGDRLYVHDSSSGAIESVDATVAAIDTEPVIGTPISTTERLDPEESIDTPFPDDTRLISDGETLWVYSLQQRALYTGAAAETGPPPAAAVDVETNTLGPIFGLTPDDDMVAFDSAIQVTAAAGHLVVERSLVDRDSDGEDASDFASVLTAFAPDGSATDFDTPIAQLRNLVGSGDLAFALAQPEDGSQAYILDPADGSATPIDLGVDEGLTVTTNHDDGSGGVWAEVTGRDVPTELLHIDLESASVVERIELTEELEHAGRGYVNGRPYFVVGDGESDEWELVILGGEGIDLGYPTPPPVGEGEDQADDDGEERDDELLADPDYQDGFERGRFNAENWGPEYSDPESFDPDASPEFKAGYADGFASYEGETGGDAGEPSSDDTVADEPPPDEQPADDECEPGQSLEECYG